MPHYLILFSFFHVFFSLDYDRDFDILNICIHFKCVYGNKLSVLSVISGKHVGPKFTLKPNTKASSLQSRKTEIKADIGGKKKRNKRRIYGLLVNGRDLRHYTKQVKSRAGERFIHETHSFMSVSFYTYLCMSVFTTSFG